MKRPKKPQPLKSKHDPAIEQEIAMHHHQERELERQAPGPKARPRGRLPDKYTPAPMPSDAAIDAVLARIRRKP